MLPIFRTRRLVLRGPEPDDAGLLTMLLSDPDVRRFLGGPVPAERVAGRIDQYLTQNALVWVVERAQPTRGLGLVSLSEHHDGEDLELSYEFDPDIWGKGYATEAARCLIDFALGPLARDRIIAETQVANAASRRLLSRLGLTELRRLKRFGADQVIYST